MARIRTLRGQRRLGQTEEHRHAPVCSEVGRASSSVRPSGRRSCCKKLSKYSFGKALRNSGAERCNASVDAADVDAMITVSARWPPAVAGRRGRRMTYGRQFTQASVSSARLTHRLSRLCQTHLKTSFSLEPSNKQACQALLPTRYGSDPLQLASYWS